MQATTERDTEGRINHPMTAATPSRIPKTINEQIYVCAGDLRALDRLTIVLNFPKVQKIDIQVLTDHPE
ncbi:unnamed protein product [Tuber melanosporum]|uniref:(Perigord truffle) hypothetical protein n=1 Tax=Tuber melanosporum (strain Mel28) TaxID=656061 RepID=D5GFR9_TUBMM|nr:uncharacterized protein GSTUM_00007041001 [Tuber melanosporum]CAZ83362.1 unnamed protein product [Tuber melanosporum]